MRDRTYKNDTAIIEANLFDEDGVNPLQATSVSWSVRKPDGTLVTGGPTGVPETEVTIAYTDTVAAGNYNAQVTFTLQDGSKRSTVLSFEVVDPLETTSQAETPQEVVVDRAWMKLEDLFDSELGGPHLRDRTLAHFDREKLKRMIPDALYNINHYYQPATGYTEDNWPTEHSPLLSQALLIEGIRHLIRSYVEQWVPGGPGTPSYFDRRDYLARWQSVLTSEETRLNMWLDLFKQGEMQFGQSSLLVGGYASFGSKAPRYMRGRYPYIARY